MLGMWHEQGGLALTKEEVNILWHPCWSETKKIFCSYKQTLSKCHLPPAPITLGLPRGVPFAFKLDCTAPPPKSATFKVFPVVDLAVSQAICWRECDHSGTLNLSSIQKVLDFLNLKFGMLQERI